MTKKDEFIEAFKTASNGIDVRAYAESKDFKKIAAIINSNEGLRAAFDEALKEAEDEKNDPAVGLGNLFAPL